MDVTPYLHSLGISALNEMQNATLKAATQDFLLLSPTGTGKTLAYLLPLINLLEREESALQAVILLPSRELAQQSEAVFRQMKTGYASMAVYGGRPTMEEHRKLRELRPQVLFATPGRLKDHIEKGNLSLSAVRVRVIDEFDKCLELGFEGEMRFIMDALSATTHTFLLSATDSEEIPQFIDLSKAVRLDFLPQEGTVKARVRHHRVLSPEKDKLGALSLLLTQIGAEQSIVFVNHRESAERIYLHLRKEGHAVELFHGGLEQDRRERALYKFVGGSAVVLVCTDLAARGLDLPDIRHIIHYHLPVNEDTYTHRNGRTARWENSGEVYLLLHAEETTPDYAVIDCDTPLTAEKVRPTQPRYTSLYIGKGKKDKISKGDIAGFLIKKGGFLPEELGRIDVRERHAYVAVNRKGAEKRLALLRNEKLKGQKVLIEPAY